MVKTTIIVDQSKRDLLKEIGKKGQTYNQIIWDLIDKKEKGND
jgi:hypothetical protein